jgi:phytoene desaturase
VGDAAEEIDVLVIGAGAGGLLTAARLAHAGLRTLVVERLDRVGGRASTHDVDGFRVNNGAIVIEVGGILEDTFAEVGADFDIRVPDPPLLYRIKGRDVDVSKGGWGLLLGGLTRQGAKLARGIGAARHDDGALPEEQLSTAEWVSRYTRNKAVHGIFRNMCASVFAVGSDELPARVFLTYFTRKSAFKRFGFCPQGTIGIWESLARAHARAGGRLWLDSTVEALTVEDGRVTGARISRAGAGAGASARAKAGAGAGAGGTTATHVRCRAVVSDAGPAATVELVGAAHLPDGYLAEVRRADRPCAMLSVNLASEHPLMEAPGMLSFAATRRLCYVANFTATCPEMAQPGWHLYVGTSVPSPAVGDFDEEAERDLLWQELRDELPGVDDARVLSTAVMRDGWPPQRAVAGFDLTPPTPLPNLWNVGDGVKEYANGGTTACAETARIVAGQVTDLLSTVGSGAP